MVIKMRLSNDAKNILAKERLAYGGEGRIALGFLVGQVVERHKGMLAEVKAAQLSAWLEDYRHRQAIQIGESHSTSLTLRASTYDLLVGIQETYAQLPEGQKVSVPMVIDIILHIDALPEKEDWKDIPTIVLLKKATSKKLDPVLYKMAFEMSSLLSKTQLLQEIRALLETTVVGESLAQSVKSEMNARLKDLSDYYSQRSPHNRTRGVVRIDFTSKVLAGLLLAVVESTGTASEMEQEIKTMTTELEAYVKSVTPQPAVPPL
ncbi:hypothetical protein RFF05_10160 [Bengtsoniella intestinalis]|uniref:hypothetical protein n=1 Tax=Bengtsoniella intestinalis TaxID=3073143 RepID=UPI00391F7E75